MTGEPSKEINYLKENGLINPHRVKKLIIEAINRNQLQLDELIVLTEAASGNYVVTPVIAAMAGAEVYAFTKDSRYGKAADVKSYTNSLARFCGVGNKIKVIFKKEREIVDKANIVTNLGFVRPIDKKLIEMMNEKAVIPYMYEAWEFREGDVDLEACMEKGIPILATDESPQGSDVFNFCGPLCAKMLFDAGIEIYGNKITVLSKDKFGKTIKDYLIKMGAEVHLVEDIEKESNRKLLRGCDSLITADYFSDCQIGKNGQISGRELKEICPHVTVIQYAGGNDIEELDRYNIPYYPRKQVGKYRMGKTLADLGPKPVIDLHCAGLKVGEVMAKARLKGKSRDEAMNLALQYSPGQKIN